MKTLLHCVVARCAWAVAFEMAQPLKLHGYQLADELTRAFDGVPSSGFQSQRRGIRTGL